MSEERCEICDLPSNQCAHSVRAKRLDLPVQVGPTIAANTYSPCEECGERIEPDEAITYTDLGWIHDHHEMVRKEPNEPRPTNPGDLMEGL